MNNNENAEYNNTLHFHVYNILCLHIIDNLTMLIGTEHRILLPFCAITGAIFLLIADSLCRTLLPATEIPIGILISLIGAPCFVYLMIKKAYGFGGN